MKKTLIITYIISSLFSVSYSYQNKFLLNNFTKIDVKECSENLFFDNYLRGVEKALSENIVPYHKETKALLDEVFNEGSDIVYSNAMTTILNLKDIPERDREVLATTYMLKLNKYKGLLEYNYSFNSSLIMSYLYDYANNESCKEISELMEAVILKCHQRHLDENRDKLASSAGGSYMYAMPDNSLLWLAKFGKSAQTKWFLLQFPFETSSDLYLTYSKAKPNGDKISSFYHTKEKYSDIMQWYLMEVIQVAGLMDDFRIKAAEQALYMQAIKRHAFSVQ